MSEPLCLEKTIWIVTDNPEKAQLIRTLLAHEDVLFETLSSAAEARERLQHIRPSIIVQFAQIAHQGGCFCYANEMESLFTPYEAPDVIVISPPIKRYSRYVINFYGPPAYTMHYEEPLNAQSEYHFQRFVHQMLELPR